MTGMTLAAVAMAFFAQLQRRLDLRRAHPPGPGAARRRPRPRRSRRPSAPRPSASRRSDAGVASAMVNTSQQVGGSIGTALLSHAGRQRRHQLRRRPRHRAGRDGRRRGPRLHDRVLLVGGDLRARRDRQRDRPALRRPRDRPRPPRPRSRSSPTSLARHDRAAQDRVRHARVPRRGRARFRGRRRRHALGARRVRARRRPRRLVRDAALGLRPQRRADLQLRGRPRAAALGPGDGFALPEAPRHRGRNEGAEPVRLFIIDALP